MEIVPMAHQEITKGAGNQPPQFDLVAATETELATFERFKRVYQRQNPPPDRPRALDKRSIGGMFWLYLATSVAAVILASMRTASQFYLSAAASGSPFLGYVEAATAVLAIEGGLVVYSAARAVRRQEVNDRSLVLAIVLMVLISMVAGIGQSIHLIDNIDPIILNYFQYALTLLLGAGTSFVAYVGGEVLGQQIVLVQRRYEEYAAAYDEHQEDYNAQLLRAWQVSDERKLVRGDLRQRVRSSSSSLSSSVSSVSSVNLPNRFGNGRRPAVQTERVARYMDQVMREEGRVASFSEVQNALDLSKSTASKLRNEWLDAHDVEVALLDRAEPGTVGETYGKENEE